MAKTPAPPMTCTIDGKDQTLQVMLHDQLAQVVLLAEQVERLEALAGCSQPRSDEAARPERPPLPNIARHVLEDLRELNGRLEAVLNIFD